MFEIVEFYKWTKDRTSKKSQDIIGTINVYLTESNSDIRGIMVKKYKNKYFFMLPSFSAIDEDTKKIVRVPYWSFTDRKKHDLFMDFLHKTGVEYIEKWMNEKLNS